MIVFWGAAFSYGIFFNSFIQDFDWSRATISGAYSVMGLMFGLTSIPTARLCDKYGPRIVIGACGVIMGIGYILMSQVHHIWQLYLFFDIFIAIGMGSYISLLPMAVKWFTKRRALMTAALTSGMGLGSVIFPPIVHYLISIYQWRFTYIILAVVIIVVTLIASQFFKADPRKIGLRPYGESPAESKIDVLTGITPKQAVRTRQFWLICALYFTYLFCQTMILVHIYIHAIGLDVPSASAAGVVSAIGIFQIVGMNVIGYTADRYSNKTGFRIAFSFMAISFIWLLLIARDTPTFYVFGAIMGFAGGSMQILFSPIVAEIFGLKSHGVILGSISFFASWGSASGSFIAGYIYDVNHSYNLAFIICCILALLAIVNISLIRPIGGKKDEIPNSKLVP